MTRQWLPVEDGVELQLIERLVRQGCSFVKALIYNPSPGEMLPSAVLTDVRESLVGLCIAAPRENGDICARLQDAPTRLAWAPWMSRLQSPCCEEIRNTDDQ